MPRDRVPRHAAVLWRSAYILRSQRSSRPPFGFRKFGLRKHRNEPPSMYNPADPGDFDHGAWHVASHLAADPLSIGTMPYKCTLEQQTNTTSIAIITLLLLVWSPLAIYGQSAGTRVWVNTRSGVYHCPGTRWYGHTTSGEYTREVDALTDGYRPAGGTRCSAGAGTSTSSAMLAETVPTRCGFERWPVKILADPDRDRIGRKPISATIRELGSHRRPQHRLPYNRRIAPEELTMFRVRATLLRIKKEKDSDLHLLLADPADPDIHMIAEIPAPDCAIGTGHEEEYRSARNAVLALSKGSVIEVTGPGFFDFMHDQRGAAPNGIEIHPVLEVRVLTRKWPNVSVNLVPRASTYVRGGFLFSLKD